MRVRVGVVALLLVLSGCTAVLGPGATPTEQGWTGDVDNHFRESTLTVAVNVSADTDRDFRPMLRDALDYWEANAEQYAEFPIEYVVDPDAESPDLEVRFVDDIEQCGPEEHTAGCAPIIETPEQVRRPVTVRVRASYSESSTVSVLKHELGHTLGLRHGDAPETVMQQRSQLTTLPQPDATERAMPWADPELSVYVDDTNVSRRERDETERQVAGALGYFADGADGTVPDNVSFVRTENRTAADVTIVFAESAPCTNGGGSCGSIRGRDPDGDGALETYTRLDIVVAGVDPEARGWHVGFWLARGFGVTESELPEPLATDDPAVRRSEWWE
ncbi:matrixin family metalloprotease [Halorarius litoreus]|uniref:matrixin family metalloprotease n=1 Tax=Halorarius litoreus TaxID=2962676 RepID=UPI0020CF5D23|nr:matrixin family metalloprotease [Halorarius litoreus]